MCIPSASECSSSTGSDYYKNRCLGTTATVFVTGGTPPYKYSLNGFDYQTSNVFTGLSRGLHSVYVLGADGCRPVTKEFLIINLINTITPNGDGINDVLNYSELKIKQNVSIEVADRYGNLFINPLIKTMYGTENPMVETFRRELTGM
jgi:hypothetical protein